MPPKQRPNDLTEGWTPVEVSVANLTDYARNMFDIAMVGGTRAGLAFGELGTLLVEGLTSYHGTYPLREGVWINELQQQRIREFQAFLAEMNQGLMAIANAAQVVAYIYDSADGESAATIQDVAFAFADAGSTKPAGLDSRLLADPIDEQIATMDRFARAHAGTSEFAASSAALHGLVTGAVAEPAINRSVRYVWPDGSYAVVSVHETSRIVNGHSVLYTTTHTSVYDKDGNLLGKRVQESGYDTVDSTRMQSTTISGADGRVTTTTDVTITPDGRVSVETQSSRSVPDGEGGQQQIVTDSHADSGDSAAPTRDDMGPVEAAMDATGSRGNQESIRVFGSQY